MEFSRHIKPLAGEADWPMWKRKIRDLLDYHEGATDVIDGKLEKPEEINAKAQESERKQHKERCDLYRKANSYAKSMIASTVTDVVYQKIMDKETAYETWESLKQQFEATSKDQLFKICTEFFAFSWVQGDDVSTHIAKLRSLWSELNNGLETKNESKLPELMLVCKILHILPKQFETFQSSWMLLAKDDNKSFEELTVQLCMFERNFANKSDINETGETLVARSKKKESHCNSHYRKKVNKKDICNYCKVSGHWVKACPKWIADGRPPKSNKSFKNKSDNITDKTANMSLMIFNEEVNHAVCDVSSFWVDNGATKHVTNNFAYFSVFESFPSSGYTIRAAGKEVLTALGKGNIKVKALLKGKTEEIELKDVWYVPGISRNLFSVLAAQDRNPNSIFYSTPTECWLKVNNETKFYGTRSVGGTLYRAAIEPVLPDKVVDVQLADAENSSLLQLYHSRWGHQDKCHVSSILKEEFGIKVRPDKEPCEPCIYGKAHRLKFGTKPKAKKVGEIISSDVCGPFDESQRKFKYFVTFKDHYSKYRYVYFLKQKSDVMLALKAFLSHAENLGHSVTEFLSDNGGEFDNRQVRQILENKGITQGLTAPYTPQQNGASERDMRTIVEMARTLKYSNQEIEFPSFLWAELVNTAVYILNRTGISSEKDVSPHELWFGKKPRIKHMRIVGSLCYTHIPFQKRRKMDKKAIKGFLIGYNGDERYRIWIPEDRKVIVSRDVIFYERTKLCEKHVSIKDIDDSSDHRQNEDSDKKQEDENTSPNVETESEDEEYVSQPSHDMKLRDRSERKKPSRFEEYIMEAESFVYEDENPETYEEAINGQENNNWSKAMEDEMSSLTENHTWDLTELPAGCKSIPCKWVYKVKRNTDGKIDRYKARLVIKGFAQRKGIDYGETFSPVARTSTIRTLISIAASQNMTLMQFDVSTAFLYGSLDVDIFMDQPEGFDDGTSRVCHLKKSLYGLKQAPRCWNKRFGKYLLDLDFKGSEADPCLFIKKKNSELMLIALYVDDGLVASTDKDQLDKFLEDLKREFKITTKSATCYLGFEIFHQKDKSIKISQTSYTKKVLERFSMSECKPASTPIVKEGFQSGKVVKNEKPFPYRQAVGALMYIMTGTRPDIAYAIGVASRCLENPKVEDWQRVKRIFRYLKGTLDKGLIFKFGYKVGILETYSDSDHGGDSETGRSTTGVVCLYAGGAISWLSQRQSSVAISTTEAEIVAASEAARELVWLTRIISEITNLISVPELKLDNVAAIKLSQNQGQIHKRSKHIKIRHFFVREMVTNGDISVKQVSTEFQVADILTKPLFSPRFLDLCRRMGLG